MFSLLTGNLFFASALIVSLAAYLRARPPMSHLIITLVCGLTASIFFSGPAAWYVHIMLALDYWALVSFLLVVAAPFLGFGYPQQRRLLLQMFFAPAAAALTVLCLTLSGVLTPITLDLYLYAFDGSLGFQPDFWGAAFLLEHRWLLTACEIAYLNLPLGMGLVYFSVADRSRPLARSTLALYLSIAAFGYVCYYLFPAAGSALVFGDAFPLHPPALPLSRIEPTAVKFAPRNCMPSLHASWVFAMCWSCHISTWRTRVATGLFAALTLFYAVPQHYFVDFVAAVPFAVAIYAGTRGRAAWRHRQVRMAAIAMASLFAIWLVALRWETAWFVSVPALSWISVLSTIVIGLVLKRRVDVMLRRSFPEPAAQIVAAERNMGAVSQR